MAELGERQRQAHQASCLSYLSIQIHLVIECQLPEIETAVTGLVFGGRFPKLSLREAQTAVLGHPIPL